MKSLFVLLLLGALAADGVACDLCGCYLGINPNYNLNTINLRYRYSSFEGSHSHMTSGSSHNHDGHNHGTTEASGNAIEQYQTLEIWSRFYPHPKLQIFASVSGAYNTELNATESVALSGLRDALLFGQFQLYNTNTTDSNAFRQRVFAGIGVKLPTGHFRETAPDGTLNPLQQPGTGSTDGMVGVTYLATYRKIGVSADAVAFANSRNSKGYRFGNRLNTTAHLFYMNPLTNGRLMPFAGLYTEMAFTDNYKNVEQVNTGGIASFASVGMELFVGRMSFNATYQLVAYEHLNGVQGRNTNRLIAGIGYAFNK